MKSKIISSVRLSGSGHEYKKTIITHEYFFVSVTLSEVEGFIRQKSKKAKKQKHDIFKIISMQPNKRDNLKTTIVLITNFTPALKLKT